MMYRNNASCIKNNQKENSDYKHTCLDSVFFLKCGNLIESKLIQNGVIRN
jgi:hypothetical protein